MHASEDNPRSTQLVINRIDRWLLRMGCKAARSLVDYRYLISVLVIGFIVWSIVFHFAVIDYVNTNIWAYRTAWLGPIPDPGTVELFGFTIPYQVEGYSDYSFYYVHWGYNTLYGVLPYSPEYGILELNGFTNENGAHMFPPFTSYLYGVGIALGNLMGWKNWGIGLLIAAFGYLTALPVYGIASELSSNRRVGEVAALTYLLNPLMLYHTDFLWFNPSPFVFFFFLGFYMLIRGKRLTGTLLIVSAALFKQTAWFLGIPLVVYLLVRPRERKKNPDEEPEGTETSKDNKEESTRYARMRSTLQPFIDYFDLRNFMVSVLLVLIFVGAVMLPYLIAQPHFLDYWRLALGSYSFEGNFVDPPAYNMPMRIQVLAIIAGLPGVAQNLDTVMLSGGPLSFGVIVCTGLMVLKDRFIGEERLYLRRILFMAMMMLFIVNILGPRGVFKYYFVVFVPFFSIFSSAKMIRGTGEHVPFSASMIWLPITLSLLILIPDRNIYLIFVILTFVGYLLAPVLDRLYHLLKTPLRFLKQQIAERTGISQKPLTVKEQLMDISRKRQIVNTVTQTALLGLGLSFILFGWQTTQMAIGVDIVTGLEVILIFSAAFVVGFEFMSIAVSMTLSGEMRSRYLNRCLRDFSYMIAAIIWIFAFRTYFLSWLVTQQIERQILVFSSVFISIWAGSLLIRQKNMTRVLTNVMLLVGLLIGLFVWNLLANTTLFLFGAIVLSAVVIHLVLILNHSFDRGGTIQQGDDQSFLIVGGKIDNGQ